MAEVILSVEGLCKTYRRGRSQSLAVNKNISFDVHRGDILTILGHNGAGKTTLLRQLVGLQKQDSGTILFNGSIRVGYMNQNRIGTIAQLTAEEACIYTACLKDLKRRDAVAETRKWFVRLGIEEIAKRRIGLLSGGEQQLVDLTLALMADPDILILDEPTSQVDPARKKIIWDIIRELNFKNKVTCILVTHNLPEAEEISNAIIIMKSGEIVYAGSMSLFKQQFDCDNVYCEISGKSLSIDQDMILSKFAELGCLKAVSNDKYVLATRRGHLETIGKVLSSPHADNLVEDFKIRTISLDDIYIRLDSK